MATMNQGKGISRHFSREARLMLFLVIAPIVLGLLAALVVGFFPELLRR
jgi:hypothetical protein